MTVFNMDPPKYCGPPTAAGITEEYFNKNFFLQFLSISYPNKTMLRSMHCICIALICINIRGLILENMFIWNSCMESCAGYYWHHCHPILNLTHLFKQLLNYNWMKSIRKSRQFKTLTFKVKLVIVRDIDKDSKEKQLAALISVTIFLCHISLSTEAT